MINQQTPSFRQLNSREPVIQQPSLPLGKLSNDNIFIVFANNLKSNEKLDLTKIENLRKVYTSEQHARNFAKTYTSSSELPTMISVVFKIENGSKLDITSIPLVVYINTAYQRVMKQNSLVIDRCQYDNYLIREKKTWLCCYNC